MSIEIEVGLENAPKIPVTLEEPLPPAPPKGLKNPKVQRILGAAAVVLVVVAVSLFLYYRNRESTDDAQIDWHITPIAAKVSGRVSEVLVNDNQPVKAGQVIAKIPHDGNIFMVKKTSCSEKSARIHERYAKAQN